MGERVARSLAHTLHHQHALAAESLLEETKATTRHARVRERQRDRGGKKGGERLGRGPDKVYTQKIAEKTKTPQRRNKIIEILDTHRGSSSISSSRNSFTKIAKLLNLSAPFMYDACTSMPWSKRQPAKRTNKLTPPRPTPTPTPALAGTHDHALVSQTHP